MHFGRYEQAVRLGAGAMGEVWKAWDPAVGRWVALKFMKGAAPDLLARFLREARALAGVDHPNITRVYEAGELDGRPFIAMEYVEGRTLGGRLEPAEAARLIRDAARGVQAAHDAGIIHRDLKPGNLMVDSGGRVRVMDFGLARPIEEGSTLTKSGLMVGTPSYMSPEQARGEIHATDARSDVYSLGATLYELASGRPPYGGASLYDVVMQVASEEPVPSPAGVPAGIAAIAMKCLEKRREDRYQSAAELSDDLDRYLQGGIVRGRPVRRIRWSLIAAAAGVFAVVLAVWAVWPRGDAVDAGELSRSADTILEAALDLRRAGNLEGMKAKAAELESLCARVIERVPASAEPHYQIGRMHRARMKFAEAAAAQDRALSLDPGHAAARRERALLTLRAYQLRMEQLQIELTMSRSIQSGGVRGFKTVLAPEDAEARRLREACERDLAALDPATTEILRLILSRSPEAASRLDEASKGRTLTEDELLWVAWVERSANRFQQAEERYTEGLSRDRGYVPLLTGRAELRHTVARIASLLRDASEHYEAALRDLNEAERLDPDIDVRAARSIVRIDWAQDCEDRGKDGLPLLDEALADLERAARKDAVVFRTIGQVHLARGREYERRGLDANEPHRAALAALDRALDLDPKLTAAWHLRAQARLVLGSVEGESLYAAALNDAEEAVKLAGHSAEAWLAKAYVQAEYALRTKDAGRLRAAIEDASEALRIEPAEPTSLRVRGVLRNELAIFPGTEPAEAELLFKGAVDDLDALVKALPKVADGWTRRGQALAQWGALRLRMKMPPGPRFEQAARSAAQAAELAPQRADTRFACGNVYLDIVRSVGERDGIEYTRSAVREFTEALKGRPGWPDAHRLRGQGHLSLATQAKSRGEPSVELYDAAIEDFTRVLEVQPRHRTVRFLRGRARHESAPPRIRLRQPFVPVLRDAVTDLEGHVADAPDDIEGRYHLASTLGTLAGAYAQFGGPSDVMERTDARALEAFEVVLKQLPTRAEAWFRRGGLHFLRKRWKEAASDFTRAVDLDPDHETARSMLAHCRKMIGE